MQLREKQKKWDNIPLFVCNLLKISILFDYIPIIWYITFVNQIKGQNMKKFIYSLIAILICCTCVLSACGGAKGLPDNPPTNAPISGNGGYAVVKGDYLYYTNGFVENYTSTYNNTHSNDFGNTTFGAIYRTKLVNGEVQYNEDGTLVKTELVVPKLVGYEKGGFYIFGDYIYYATPHMEKQKDGTLRNDLVDFNRIKIDGTDNKEKLYVSATSVTNDNWRMYSANGNVYIVVAETADGNTTLKSIAINAKGKASARVLASNVTSYALYEGTVDSDSVKYVYYTKAKTSGQGNILNKVNFVNGAVVELNNATNNTTEFTILAYRNHKIYFSAVIPVGGVTKTELSYISVDVEFSLNSATKFAYSTYDEYVVADYNSDIVVVRNSSSLAIVKVCGEECENTISDVNKLIGFVGDELYYLNSSSKLMKVQVTTDTAQAFDAVQAYENEKTAYTEKFDVNGNNAYIFVEYTSASGATHYYLNKISGNDARFVGLFVSNHAPEKIEDSEDIWIY